MPPTIYDSTSVSCGATCIPELDNQCCVHGRGFVFKGRSGNNVSYPSPFNLRLAIYST